MKDVAAGHHVGLLAARRDHTFEAVLARRIQQDIGEGRVILDDQHHPVAHQSHVHLDGDARNAVVQGSPLDESAYHASLGTAALGTTKAYLMFRRVSV